MTRRPPYLPVLKRAVLFGGVWAVLVAGDTAGLAAGVPAVAAATWLSLRLLPAGEPVRLLAALRFLPHFARVSFLGGLDVAWRAAHPRLPVDPGWKRVPVGMSDGRKAVLGGELSLMPGTLVAGSDGDGLLLHSLDRAMDIGAMVRDEERRLAEVAGGGRAP